MAQDEKRMLRKRLVKNVGDFHPEDGDLEEFEKEEDDNAWRDHFKKEDPQRKKHVNVIPSSRSERRGSG